MDLVDLVDLEDLLAPQLIEGQGISVLYSFYIASRMNNMFIVAVVLVATFFVACDALSGWTYEATSSSCAGTDADPCGPVRLPTNVHAAELV